MELDCGICKVRSCREEDAESLAFHANNRKIWLQLRDAFPFPCTREDAHNFINIARTVKPDSFFTIDIEGNAAGSIGISQGKDIGRISGETGYWLGEQFGGRRIVTAAIKHSTNYALNEYNLVRIFARLSVIILPPAGFWKKPDSGVKVCCKKAV